MFTFRTSNVYSFTYGHHEIRRKISLAQTMRQPNTLALFLLISLTTLLIIEPTLAVVPTIDYSHNMRILKLPSSTQVGELIYRLKGSDGDAQSQLVFGVGGIEARQLLDVIPVSGSWNEADVYLRAPLNHVLGNSSHNNKFGLDNSMLKQINLTLFVSDGNTTTTVDSTILVTNDDDQLESNDQHEPSNFEAIQQNPDINSNTAHSLSPFIKPVKQVYLVPENSQPGESIGFISVRESSTSELPVRFELRGKGSEHFQIKYVFGPRGQSRAKLELALPVDYERQNLYALKVLALNAWTATRLDTRNVATLDILVAVGDVQDTGPIFSSRSPRLLRVSNEMQPGNIVARVEAHDGDLADQRPIAYALDASSMLANRYFDIDNKTGAISLKRAATELNIALAVGQSASSGASQQDLKTLTVFASELPDPSSYEHLWPPMVARLELPILMVDTRNEPPYFYGGWQTQEPSPRGAQPVLHGFLRELPGRQNVHRQQSARLPVQWFTNLTHSQLVIADETIQNLVIDKARGQPVVVDFGQGLNGTFELSLEGRDAHLFELEPVFAVIRQTQFSIRVAPQANCSLFDLNHYPRDQQPLFQFDLVARDFGPAGRQTSRIKCLIELLDSEDIHWPVFERESYTFQVFESAPPGQSLGSVMVRRRRPPSSSQIRYTSLTGQETQLFHLDQESGLITLAGKLDRETQAQYLLLAEACHLDSACNYTKVIINVLDVNDNGPVFGQSHYGAMLQPDGRFEKPLIVHALDADEPNSMNSLLAYEIIAGDHRDLFDIDSKTGEIFLSDLRPSSPAKIQLPSILSEPIEPYSPIRSQAHRRPLELAGKILPSESAISNPELKRHLLHSSRPPPVKARLIADGKQSSLSSNSIDKKLTTTLLPTLDLNEQMPAIDLLLNPGSGLNGAQLRSLDEDQSATSATTLSDQSSTATASGSEPTNKFEPLKLPAMMSLVIRAHDFGISIRSATCKVIIYNQALQSRWLSLILNGTVPELEKRRGQIERSYGTLTGSSAQIDSIDALSDSSSLSVARMRLISASGHHQLVDLTDLSGLMQALHIKPVEEQQERQTSTTGKHQQDIVATVRPIFGPTYIIPSTHNAVSSNLTSPGLLPHGFYADQQNNPFAPYHSSLLEKKLLIYIIIVGVVILLLLIIWLIYSCIHEDRVVKIVERPTRFYLRRGRTSDNSLEQLEEAETDVRGKDYRQCENVSTKPKQLSDNLALIGNSAIGNNLAKQQTNSLSVGRAMKIAQRKQGLPVLNGVKSDHLSLYKGQVWFETSDGVAGAPINKQVSISNDQSARSTLLHGEANPISEQDGKPRLSIDIDSLDSALHKAINSSSPSGSRQPYGLKSDMPAGGNILSPRSTVSENSRFFPNARGYVNNLMALDREVLSVSMDGSRTMNKRARRTKVAPNGKLGDGSRTGRNKHLHRSQGDKDNNSTRSCDSASSSGGKSSSVSLYIRRHDSITLESKQELLGFDDTGEPIIAIHSPDIKSVANESEVNFLGAQQHDSTVKIKTDKDTEGTVKKSRDISAEGIKGEEENVTGAGRLVNGRVGGDPLIEELTERLNQVASKQQKQQFRQTSIRNSLQAIDSDLNLGLERQEHQVREEAKCEGENLDNIGKQQVVDDGRLLDSQLLRQTISKRDEESSSRKAPLNEQQSTISEDSVISLNHMKYRELLEKQSIFAMINSGLATNESLR